MIFVLVVIFLVVLLMVLVVAVLLLHGHEARGFRISRNFVVVPFPVKAVHVPGEVAAAPIEPERAAAAVSVISPPYVELAGDAVRHLVRDAARMRIHDAADGAGPVQQRGRTLENLDAVRDERVYRYRVVAAGDGYVEGVDAVFEHAHPGSVEAVNDRAARRDPEGTVVDARFVGDRGADAVGDLALEFLTGNYVAGLGDALRGKRVADDKDFFDDGVRPFGRRILREGERRQTSCQREW